MSREHWVVKNNTGGLLYLPRLGLSFRDKDQEKELCFLTGKTVAELEKDSEISHNLDNKNLTTISKEKSTENSDILLDKINNLEKIIKNKEAPSPVSSSQIDLNSLMEAIRSEIKSSLLLKTNEKNGENIVLSKDGDETAREEVIKQLIFKSKDNSIKNFEELGSEKQTENESDGNEDLLGDIDI